MNVWKPGGVLFENMLRRSSESVKRRICAEPHSQLNLLLSNGYTSEQGAQISQSTSEHNTQISQQTSEQNANFPKDSDSENLKNVHNKGEGGGRITGLLYYQGETDGGDAVSAGEYARNLTDFIVRVRQVFSANLPVVLCLISGVDARVPYRDVVRDAQMRVAKAFSAVRVVETCDLELKVRVFSVCIMCVCIYIYIYIYI